MSGFTHVAIFRVSQVDGVPRDPPDLVYTPFCEPIRGMGLCALADFAQNRVALPAECQPLPIVRLVGIIPYDEVWRDINDAIVRRALQGSTG